MMTLNKHFKTGINHLNTINAAADKSIKTSQLIIAAKQILTENKLNEYKEDKVNLPLIVLHHRAGEELLNDSKDLLKSRDLIDRELGCLIMKEFPSINEAPTKYSPRIISAIEKMINEEENNTDILVSGLSAIGWQCHTKAQNIFRLFINDERELVREVIANNLLKVMMPNGILTSFIIEGFNQLGRDPIADIRWSIFYDMSEHFELFENDKNLFYQLPLEGMEDPNSDVRLEALSAFKKLY
ncbi:hypothetical protein [Flammeovirga sp. EKP202]|uniref:hypothetical protein n=1 Tax=Flammeovirga sp. EKP202 TaxID=2770592 RepID=UPI00165FBFC6|nr:hypothetical protein [Flammeovirga sp. EKP202]MBD0403714.1 hypothetical protein [Flammeovirga sp. EKP202]